MNTCSQLSSVSPALLSSAVVLKVWVATQKLVAKTLKMGRAKLIQIRQKDSLQNQEFSKAADFFPFIKSIKIFASYTFSWLHLNEIKDYSIISSFLKF